MFYKTVNLYKTINFYKALNFYKTLNIYKAFNICKALNIHKILLPLDDCGKIYKINKVYKDKVSRPVLDTEEITILLNTNVKA